jgi:GNAT superfamily N-acetyltransferase
METTETTRVEWLDPTTGHEGDLVDRLVDLVNEVYETAESGLWVAGATRTTAAEMIALIRARQIAIAVHEGRLVGSVQIHDVGPDVSEFGMLVAAPEHRGIGIGRALLEFAERDACARGLRAMRLELLQPRTWRHASKEFLRSWYQRCGYRAVSRTRMVDTHPHLAPLLATECDLVVYEKPLP